jgi:hypothetical protein
MSVRSGQRFSPSSLLTCRVEQGKLKNTVAHEMCHREFRSYAMIEGRS